MIGFAVFADVQLEDQANFTCLARNEFGEQRKHTNVVVTGLGWFTLGEGKFNST